MLRLRDGQGALWDEFLPPEVRVPSDELTAIDTLPDDDRFLAPFSRRLMTRIGRPTIPMETYLRLMYRCLSWRRFCRIRLDDHAPHSTTLIKPGGPIPHSMASQPLQPPSTLRHLSATQVRVYDSCSTVYCWLTGG